MLHSTLRPAASSPIFLLELERLGPEQLSTWGLKESLRYCRWWATAQYENFTVVSWLLPRGMRQDFYNVYAYCRWADNLADEVGDRERSLELLDWWNWQLQLCYTGQPKQPVLIALQQTIRKYGLPIKPFTDLLSAFRQDRAVFRYRDEAQILDYCRRSANPVGRILLGMAQVAGETTLDFSDRICTGLQIANFCQDMSRDAELGRIYAPASLQARHGVSEEMLLGGRVTPEVQAMLMEWSDMASELLSSGRQLVYEVPRWLRVDIELFVRGGMAILAEIRRSNFDVWKQRPTVSKWKKLQLLVRGLAWGWVTCPIRLAMRQRQASSGAGRI